MWIMLKSKKLFKSVLNFFQTLGIYPLQQNESYTFNWISLAILLSMIGTCISTATYFLFEAETIDELSIAFYVSVTELNFLVCFVGNIWKMKSILQMIEKNEKFIEKSESIWLIIFVLFHRQKNWYFLGSNNMFVHNSFNQLNAKIEWMCRFLHFFVTRLTLIGLMSPSVLITLGNHFIYGLGDGSYYLSCPLSYVQNSINWMYKMDQITPFVFPSGCHSIGKRHWVISAVTFSRHCPVLLYFTVSCQLFAMQLDHIA